MGLDLYVGSLTRYFCGDWETALQKTARKKGLHYVNPEAREKEEELPAREEMHPLVLEWQQELNGKIKLTAPMAWDETPQSPYFTDQLHFQGHSSLLLWAAYYERKDLVRPKECVDDFNENEAYLSCSADDSKTEFAHLLKNTVCWLPADFAEPFAAMDACGAELRYGSTQKLIEELIWLNNQTWKAERADIERWRRLGLGQSCTLEEAAQYAMAVLLPLTEKSVEHKLVMRLDW
ncbi:MAG: hypothetical protein IT342_21185 [Candidatus Melainabacteria bacterium]|nr:hypothetical protein [Candidatus Melainabacteria bacterium]